MTYSRFPSGNPPQSYHVASYRLSLWETEAGRAVTLAPSEGRREEVGEVVLRAEGVEGQGEEGGKRGRAGSALRMCFHLSFLFCFTLFWRTWEITRTVGSLRCVEEGWSGMGHGQNVK